MYQHIRNLLVLIGGPGVGKTFAGFEILHQEFGFMFFDADWIIPQEMIEAHKRKQDPSNELRDHYTCKIIQRTQALSSYHSRIVVVQAFLKRRNRWQFLEAFP